jgi:SecD/SecF fusion protein
VSDGYKRSLAPVLDGHITTLLTAIILAYFGLGPVLGFATTQIIGILLSLFCGILVSRLITDWYTNKNRHFEYFTDFSKKIFQKAAFKFIEYRKVAYAISLVIFLLGVSTFFNGFDEGVEFSGGRSYTVKFDKPVNVEEVRDQLKVVFEESPIIKTVNSNNQLNITTSYKIEETGNTVDAQVEQKLFEGLQKQLPAGLTFKEFETKYKQSSQTVLPTISDDLKAGATKATILAVLVICLYIFIRFRDWRYSLGTIFSLMHDVFVTLIVFSYARTIVPFPLEIDQHFIAAILTVIGFSMNDTVIVYDRIREDSGLMKGVSNGVIINKAINETLSRTIMTSVTVFLTLLILFIFGGEVTRGFSFAMLIGVITGSYSSIFVAAPILVDFAKNKPLGKATEKK